MVRTTNCNSFRKFRRFISVYPDYAIDLLQKSAGFTGAEFVARQLITIVYGNLIATKSLKYNGAPGRIRTCDLRLRKPALYPAELRARSWEGRPFLALNGSAIQQIYLKSALI